MTIFYQVVDPQEQRLIGVAADIVDAARTARAWITVYRRDLTIYEVDTCDSTTLGEFAVGSLMEYPATLQAMSPADAAQLATQMAAVDEPPPKDRLN